MPKKKKHQTTNKKRLSPTPSRDDLEGVCFPKNQDKQSHSSSTADLDMFMEAIDHIEVEAKGLITENALANQANARRLKQLQSGQIKPDAELDLHGLLVPAAKQKVRHFIDNANYHGLKTVILITGKGLHSSNGPVLRSEIETLLNELNEQVIEWSLAPRRFGGDGALVVFLRGNNR